MVQTIKKERNILIYFAVFLITLSLFSYEVLLTRLFSVLLSFNLVFMVVSFSILGGGLGGIYTYRKIQQKEPVDIQKMIVRYSLLLSLSIIGTILLIYKLPYIKIYSLYAFVGIIPFMIGGSIISIIFKEFTDKSSKLYFMDLIGAGLGSVVIIKIMNLYGFMNSVAIVTMIALLASILVSVYFKKTKTIITGSIIFIILLGFVIEACTLLEIEQGFTSYYSSPNTLIDYLKDTDEKPTGISYSKWNAVSRTDVIETTNEKEKIVVTDGGGSAPIVKFDGDLNSVRYLKKTVGYIPFAIGENDDTLIIGSGGGKDVVLALLGNSKNITAVEINSSTIEAVNEFKSFSGDIYGRPEVTVYNQDGRNFIENTEEKYDNIFLSMVMTNAIENTMYSLSENYLFTEEAFKEYFSKLKDNGKLSFMAHSALDMTRIINTGIKVLIENGVDREKITDYFIVVNGASEEHRKKHKDMISMPMVIFKKIPFTDKEIISLLDVINYQKRQIIHYPGGEYELFKRFANGEMSYDEMIGIYGLNIRPIKDSSPFFYNYSYLVPKEIIFIGIWMLGIWIVVKRRYFKEESISRISKYFIAIGMAYMLIEIPIVQKASLYFGNPTIAFSSILFSILISSGIGSLMSGHKKVKKYTQESPMYLLVTAVGVVSVLLAIDRVILLTNGFDTVLKLITMFLMLLPMGILMGIPFPAGMSKIKEITENKDVIPLMWGVNGIFSVIGSILAVSISMKFGFNITILAGAALYLYLYMTNPLD